jgi:O-antigen/teichoic acid export membrane protein
LNGLLGAQLVAQLVALGLTLRWVAEWIRADDRGPGVATCLKRSLGYGWKAHVGNILAFLNYKADVFLANLFLGPAAVGVYVIAVALAEKLWLISQAVSTVLLPRLAQLSRDDAKRKQLTPLIARWLLLITAMAALVLAWLAHTLIDVVFGSEYAAAVLPLWILLPGMVLMAVYRVLANDIAARGRPELNMLVALAVVVVNLAANLILIPWLGLAGAAAATTIAYALSLVMGLKFYRRLSGNDWQDALCLTLDDARWLAHGWRAAKPGSQT